MKTPQEKKRLSYAKDRRNTYGESNKGSRKSIRKNKAHQLRAERHALNATLTNVPKSTNFDDLTAAENNAKIKFPRTWKKCPDKPLGEVVKRRLARRIYDFGAKIQRRERREASTTGMF
jgi:hypothetical protein